MRAGAFGAASVLGALLALLLLQHLRVAALAVAFVALACGGAWVFIALFHTGPPPLSSTVRASGRRTQWVCTVLVGAWFVVLVALSVAFLVKVVG